MNDVNDLPAPFWRRLAARLLDLAFALGLTFVLVIPIGLLLFPFLPVVDEDGWAAFGAALCYLVAYIGLEFFLLARRQGQTLGKGLMGLRVVSANEGQRVVSLPSALSRLVGLFLPFVLMSVAGGNPGLPWAQVLGNISILILLASLILAAVPKWNRRALHDYLSGTRVVRAAKRRIDFQQDARMVLPGRIDLTKRVGESADRR